MPTNELADNLRNINSPEAQIAGLIRTRDDAIGLAVLLKQFCVDLKIGVQFAEELENRIAHWDAPSQVVDWHEITELTTELSTIFENHVFGEDAGRWLLVAEALGLAAKSKGDQRQA